MTLTPASPAVRRVLVTGIDGFTGHYVAAGLRAAGYEVHGLTHEKTVDDPLLHACDLTSQADVDRAVRAIAPDKVVHLAAISFVQHEDVDEIYRVNVIGTRHLLHSLAALERKPDAVLLASSANIYGNRIEGAISEEAAPDPINDYAVSKLSMEYVARLYQQRLPIIVTRPFNYTGVGQAANFLIPKIVDHFRRRAPVIELGNIDVARDFSDVRTVAAAYCALLEAPSAPGHTFNICSGKAYSLLEIINMARQITGHNIEIRINPAFVRENEVRILKGENDKLSELISLRNQPDIQSTLQWMMDSP